MATKKQLIQKVKIAQKQIGIPDDDYRELLENSYGVESCTKLTMQQLNGLIHHFQNHYGWKAKSVSKKPKSGINVGYQGDYIKIDDSDPLAQQKRYALVLAKNLGWKLSGLDTRCKKQFHVERFVWIKKQIHMQTLIKDMINRCKKKNIKYTV